MNMKSNKININPAFEKLFSFKSQHEKNEHNAQMISFRILSEVEKICEDKKIRKKELAKMVGTSPSYITQLFRGTKQVNTEIMARFEEALGISFTITAKLNEETYDSFWARHMPKDFFTQKRIPLNGKIMYYFDGGKVDKTNEIVSKMETENKTLQTA